MTDLNLVRNNPDAFQGGFRNGDRAEVAAMLMKCI